MNRFLKQLLNAFGACIILLTIGCAESEPDTETERPNIIIFLTDDQGWGDLSINGNKNLSTPHIDNLARSGVTFERFYVSPVCSPTRAEILTGRYHPRSGVYSTSAGGERLDLDETTLTGIFQNAGYETGAYGKWHNGMQPPYHPNARGVDDFYGFCSGHWGNYFSPTLEHNGWLVDGEGYIIDDLTEHGLQFMEKNKDNPFLLYFLYNTPHSPMQVPGRWWEKFENNELEQLHRDAEKEDVQHTKAALAMCENIDWNVGRILDKVDELGLTENTIVIYFSDNGPNGWRWNGGMKGRKGSTDEGGVRSPTFMKWEGKFEPGKKIEQIAGAIDLLPTLADLSGIPYATEKPLDGLSLKPLLLGKNPQWEDRYIFSYWNKRTSVRSQRYRLDHEGQLFDMVTDPGQYHDIADEEPQVLERLTVVKSKWEQEVLKGFPPERKRPFTLGDPEFDFTQMPARDGIAHGNIKRSNRYPNCSYFLNWTSLDDKITWDVEVLSDGKFEVEIHYTCPEEDIGSAFKLSLGESILEGKITEPHDPALIGMEHDLVERQESYVKDFKPLKMGTIKLKKGKGTLTLQATDIPGSQVMEFRLMMFKRIKE